jgi:hypothetical protein
MQKNDNNNNSNLNKDFRKNIIEKKDKINKLKEFNLIFNTNIVLEIILRTLILSYLSELCKFIL